MVGYKWRTDMETDDATFIYGCLALGVVLYLLFHGVKWMIG